MAKKKKVVKKAVKKTKGIIRQVKIEKIGRKPTKVTIKQQVLGKAPKEKEFYLKDGRKLKNVLELTHAMEDMAEETFSHHVTEIKNDFSTWVKDVFGEKELAKEMEKAKNKMEIELKLLKKMVKELAKT